MSDRHGCSRRFVKYPLNVRISFALKCNASFNDVFIDFTL
eukprot:09493.XXX_111848_111967_1 [CDS] Oithona nana genome sequencing.